MNPAPTFRHYAPGIIAFGVLLATSSPLIAEDLTALEEQAIRAAVQRVAPSVVRIDTVGGLEHVEDLLLGEGPTTGLVVSSDGYIVSSTFNFLRLPTSILVTLSGGHRLPARIVARDHSCKLVLLKIDATEPLLVPTASPAEEVQVGQWAIAIGRTFNVDKPNVSVGIVSARDRIWGKAIQTDANVSPSNYGGPLVDLQGRVLGVLAPLSPSSEQETAGAEWYDGGIGFAVPLAAINQRLDRLKSGEDLHPGLLGVSLKPGDIYSMPAEIAACQPKSPAYVAGLRVGDTIVEINDTPVNRQSQLRHVLGRLYAGETVDVIAMRSGERHEFSVQLAKEIEPYEHPFLGILPKRGDSADQKGIEVRYVYPDSGAAAAGIQAGDRILKIADQDVTTAQALRDAVAALESGKDVTVVIDRKGEEKSLQAKLGTLPTTFPPKDAADPAPAADEAKPQAATTIKIPEEPNECIAYIPSSYRKEYASSLLVVLPPPGGLKADEFTSRWSGIAERYRMIVVAPQAGLPNTWLPSETTFIRKVIDHFSGNYNIDRSRIVVYGSQASGAMAYLTAFRLRDVVRGVVAVDAAMPLLLARPPDNDAIERLAVVMVRFAGSPINPRMQQNREVLTEFKYPVTAKELPGDPRPLDESTREEIVIWMDTLDRI